MGMKNAIDETDGSAHNMRLDDTQNTDNQPAHNSQPTLFKSLLTAGKACH
jgi:hypothetical protein